VHISIEHEGRSYPNVTAEQAREIGVPEEAIAAAMAEIDARTRRSEIRRDLADGPGDTASLLGTTADGTALLLVEVAKFARSLSAATSLAEMRDAAQPLVTLTEQFLIGVEDGSIKLPYQHKGAANDAIVEFSARASGVTAVLQAADDE
tara:strand:- start:703 stop:1149 length:447 start_codon:yes stop_codon:yes gene_type:complete